MRHDQHRRRSNDVALSKALEYREQLHPVPKPVISKVKEVALGRIIPSALMHNHRSGEREDEYDAGDDLVGASDLGGIVAAIPANEGPDHKRHHDAYVGGEESLQAVVIIAVAIAGGG